jgi:hypothetical protein
MWAAWAVGLAIGFLGTLTAGDIGLAVVFGLLLVVDLAGAAFLRRTGRRPMTS